MWSGLGTLVRLTVIGYLWTNSLVSGLSDQREGQRFPKGQPTRPEQVLVGAEQGHGAVHIGWGPGPQRVGSQALILGLA